jgi:hypothetical protein
MAALDLTRLQNYGFTSVRIFFDPVYWEEEAGYPAMVYAGVDQYLAGGFQVTLGLAPTDAYRTEMQSDSDMVTALATLWTEVATELSSRSTTMLRLDLMNEPIYHGNAAAWYTDQQELHDAMRAAAPNHTIIATGHTWSTAADLVLLTPIDDANTIYSFHYYTPGEFTFQGEGGRDELYGLPYPSTPANVATAVALIEPAPGQTQLDLATAYGAAVWDRDTLEADFLSVYNWGVTNSEQVIMNEFGARKVEAPAASIKSWVADVRYLTRKYGIERSWWSYTLDTRGFMDGPNQDPAERTVNTAIEDALAAEDCNGTHTIGTFDSP